MWHGLPQLIVFVPFEAKNIFSKVLWHVKNLWASDQLISSVSCFRKSFYSLKAEESGVELITLNTPWVWTPSVVLSAWSSVSGLTVAYEVQVRKRLKAFYLEVTSVTTGVVPFRTEVQGTTLCSKLLQVHLLNYCIYVQFEVFVLYFYLSISFSCYLVVHSIAEINVVLWQRQLLCRSGFYIKVQKHTVKDELSDSEPFSARPSLKQSRVATSRFKHAYLTLTFNTLTALITCVLLLRSEFECSIFAGGGVYS